MTWKFISTSVTGKSHIDRNEKGQDYCRSGVIQISDKEFFIGLVADGAGSTTDGGLGAKIACEITYSSILSTIGQVIDPSLITEKDIKNWIISSRESIDRHAKKNGKHLKDYACTLNGSVIGSNYSIYFQIGDGGIVINSGHEYQPIFWPEQGEYINTTYFISDESFLEHLNIKQMDCSPNEIALFTDGLQNLVLSYSQKTAHNGFFSPLFDYLRKNPCNEFVDLSTPLHTFLNRTEINDRSDDDKTLILALRSTI